MGLGHFSEFRISVACSECSASVSLRLVGCSLCLVTRVDNEFSCFEVVESSTNSLLEWQLFPERQNNVCFMNSLHSSSKLLTARRVIRCALALCSALWMIAGQAEEGNAECGDYVWIQGVPPAHTDNSLRGLNGSAASSTSTFGDSIFDIEFGYELESPANDRPLPRSKCGGRCSQPTLPYSSIELSEELPQAIVMKSGYEPNLRNRIVSGRNESTREVLSQQVFRPPR